MLFGVRVHVVLSRVSLGVDLCNIIFTIFGFYFSFRIFVPPFFD